MRVHPNRCRRSYLRQTPHHRPVRQSRQIRFLCLSCCVSFLFVSGRKKTATAKRQLRSYESILSFHVLRAEPGAYLSPSFHLRPEIAPPFICSDLEYRSILAQDFFNGYLRSVKETSEFREYLLSTSCSMNHFRKQCC